MATRILVTGGTGVIGAWAVREIAAAGDTPIVVTRGQTEIGRSILGELADEIEWFSADIQQPLSLMDTVLRARPDVIAHLASAKPWQMDVGYVERPDPGLGVRTIVDGTLNVLEIARSLGIAKVVYASSKAAYAPFTGEHAAPRYRPVPETYPARPVDIYGITKLAAEQLGGYYRDHLGVDFVALRFASTYGPFKRGAGAAPGGLIGAAVEGHVVDATYREAAYTTSLDEFVYNRDVGRAVQIACAAPPVKNVTFNIGTGVGHTVADVVEAISSVDGVATPNITLTGDDDGDAAGHLIQGYTGILDVSAARDQLGFEARYDLRDGIEDAAEVVRAADRSQAV